MFYKITDKKALRLYKEYSVIEKKLEEAIKRNNSNEAYSQVFSKEFAFSRMAMQIKMLINTGKAEKLNVKSRKLPEDLRTRMLEMKHYDYNYDFKNSLDEKLFILYQDT